MTFPSRFHKRNILTLGVFNWVFLFVCLFGQTLKRKEKEYEHDMERLAREKIATQQRLAELKNEVSQWMDVMEIDRLLRQTVQPEEDQASTSTASGNHTQSLLDEGQSYRREQHYPQELLKDHKMWTFFFQKTASSF